MSSFDKPIWVIFWEEKTGGRWGHGLPILKEEASELATECNCSYPNINHVVLSPLAFFKRLSDKVGEEKAKETYKKMFPDFPPPYNPYA